MTYAQDAKMINDHLRAGNQAGAKRVYSYVIRTGRNRAKLDAAIEADAKARKAA